MRFKGRGEILSQIWATRSSIATQRLADVDLLVADFIRGQNNCGFLSVLPEKLDGRGVAAGPPPGDRPCTPTGEVRPFRVCRPAGGDAGSGEGVAGYRRDFSYLTGINSRRTRNRRRPLSPIRRPCGLG